MSKVTFIGEIGQNHRGDLPTALHLMDGLSKAGCDYIKFQAYDTDSIFDGTEPFYAQSLQAEMTKNQMFFLARTLNAINLKNNTNCKFLCSVFDGVRLSWYYETYARYFKEEPVWPIKIASRSALDEPLLEAIRGFTKMPGVKSMFGIISHGGQTKSKDEYKKQFAEQVHLYCKMDYPCEYDDDDWNIMKNGFATNAFQGLSDHSIGCDAIQKAIDLGATWIEKHITFVGPPHERHQAFVLKHTKRNDQLKNMSFEDWLEYDKSASGPDHSLSIRPEDLAEIIERNR